MNEEKILMIVSTIPNIPINSSMQSGQIMSSNDYINQQHTTNENCKQIQNSWSINYLNQMKSASTVNTTRFLTPISYYSEPTQHGRFIVQGTKLSSGHINSDDDDYANDMPRNFNQGSKNIDFSDSQKSLKSTPEEMPSQLVPLKHHNSSHDDAYYRNADPGYRVDGSDDDLQRFSQSSGVGLHSRSSRLRHKRKSQHQIQLHEEPESQQNRQQQMQNNSGNAQSRPESPRPRKKHQKQHDQPKQLSNGGNSQQLNDTNYQINQIPTGRFVTEEDSVEPDTDFDNVANQSALARQNHSDSVAKVMAV